MFSILALRSISINTAIVAEDANEKWSRLILKSEKPCALNLQLHTRIYLLSYVRYLCRTKSHLCRSQNKLLIIEIRRILCCYVNGLHTVDEARHNHTSSYLFLLAEEALHKFCNATWFVADEIFIKIINHDLWRARVFDNVLTSLLWNVSVFVFG